MNPALVLTIFRIILIPPFVLLFARGASTGRGNGLLLPLFVLIALSDVLDGPLARSRQQVSTLGTILDVGSDLTFILAVLWTGAFKEMLPWWIPAAISVQILQFIGDSLLFFSPAPRRPLRENRLGKVAGVLYYLLVGLLSLHLSFPGLLSPALLSSLFPLVFAYTLLCLVMRARLYWQSRQDSS
ncbi:MAG: CDP-alcohol phosphatidyltransferase family protein [Nitrospinota bacterium]|nr:MAG: CDP-alcohol phosphatidyltransferase family protein [Nitrospinota bacterium]